MSIGKLLIGAAFCLVAVTLATPVGLVVEHYTGLDDRVIWFIFGGVYFQVCQKMGL